MWLWAEEPDRNGTSCEAPAEAEVKGGVSGASGMVEEVAGRGQLGDLFWRDSYRWMDRLGGVGRRGRQQG